MDVYFYIYANNVFRSCELDEWTADQLQLMRLSGNENAKAFFKKHGVTDTQMLSEKKYKTKAAQEYRRHLQKLIEAESSGQLMPASEDGAPVDGTDELKAGIDRLLLSSGDAAAAGEDNAATNLTTSSSPTVPEPETVFEAAAATTRSKAVAHGTLTVAAVSEQVEPSDATVEAKAAAVVLPTKIGAKKSAKKGLGARRLETSAADIGIASFESADKQALKAAAVASKEDGSKGRKGGEIEEKSGPSRVMAAYAETVTPPAPSSSIYKPAAAPNGSSSSSSSSSSSIISSSYGYQAPNKAEESFAARGKYTNAKGISSDQYFGREEADEFAARSKLQAYSNSTAISSDMLSGERSMDEDSFDTSGLSALKDSVASFFSDVSRRMG